MKNHLGLRDYLVAQPEAAREYGDLKEALPGGGKPVIADRTLVASNEELNLTGASRWRLARDAREPHLVWCAGRLTPAH